MTPAREVDVISKLWTAYTAWLAEHAPEALANLAPGATDAELTALAAGIEPALPSQLVALLRLSNGQREPKGCCAVPGLEFLSTQRILEEWQSWEDFRDGETEDGLESLDDYARALDPGVLDKYTHPGWVPAFKDGWRADYLGFDMAPDAGGVVGQLINFGRDEDKHFIAFPTLPELLEFWLALVRAGNCRVYPPDLPDQPSLWFAHERNGIDVLRSHAAQRRENAREARR
jgi:cell wall assembly regulator SMI1